MYVHTSIYIYKNACISMYGCLHIYDMRTEGQTDIKSAALGKASAVRANRFGGFRRCGPVPFRFRSAAGDADAPDAIAMETFAQRTLDVSVIERNITHIWPR